LFISLSSINFEVLLGSSRHGCRIHISLLKGLLRIVVNRFVVLRTINWRKHIAVENTMLFECTIVHRTSYIRNASTANSCWISRIIIRFFLFCKKLVFLHDVIYILFAIQLPLLHLGLRHFAEIRRLLTHYRWLWLRIIFFVVWSLIFQHYGCITWLCCFSWTLTSLTIPSYIKYIHFELRFFLIWIISLYVTIKVYWLEGTRGSLWWR